MPVTKPVIRVRVVIKRATKRQSHVSYLVVLASLELRVNMSLSIVITFSKIKKSRMKLSNNIYGIKPSEPVI